MKEAEKIINGIKYWSDKDPKNRTAVVILTDKKEESKVWGRFTGTTREMGNLIYSLMTKNKELGHDIYVAACLYAQMHITAEERDKINAVISASAEARKKINAVISASAEARKKIEAIISASAEARKKIEAIISAHKKPKGGEK